MAVTRKDVYQIVFKMLLVAAVFATVYLFGQYPGGPTQVIKNPLTCDAVDVVYTWVNGSDPKHLAKVRQVNKELGKYK